MRLGRKDQHGLRISKCGAHAADRANLRFWGLGQDDKAPIRKVRTCAHARSCRSDLYDLAATCVTSRVEVEPVSQRTQGRARCTIVRAGRPGLPAVACTRAHSKLPQTLMEFAAAIAQCLWLFARKRLRVNHRLSSKSYTDHRDYAEPQGDVLAPFIACGAAAGVTDLAVISVLECACRFCVWASTAHFSVRVPAA